MRRGGRVHLGARIALQECALYPPPPPPDAEARGPLDAVEAVVELAPAELEALGRERAAVSARDLMRVELQRSHRGKLDQPVLARDARQREIWVKPERQRHGIRSGRVHGQLDLQAPVAQARAVAQVVAKREQLEQLRLLLAP